MGTHTFKEAYLVTFMSKNSYVTSYTYEFFHTLRISNNILSLTKSELILTYVWYELSTRTRNMSKYNMINTLSQERLVAMSKVCGNPAGILLMNINTGLKSRNVAPVREMVGLLINLQESMD